MKGNTPIIAHEGPEYDNWRMNNPYNADPDETGVRAAFTGAQVSDEVCVCLCVCVCVCVLKRTGLPCDHAPTCFNEFPS